MKALRVLSKQLGQSAPTPHRGLEPLSADHRGGPDSERGEREGVLPPRGRAKKDLRGGLDDTEGGHQDSSFEEDMNADRGGHQKRGKRKKRDRDAEAGIARPDGGFPGALAGLAPVSQQHSPSAHGSGGLAALPSALAEKLAGGESALDKAMKGGLLEMKKPDRSNVEEVRQGLGLSSAVGRLPPMGPMGHSNPFGSQNRLPGDLPELPGDGLSTVGRAKVRAGIRLEPLHGGA